MSTSRELDTATVPDSAPGHRSAAFRLQRHGKHQDHRKNSRALRMPSFCSLKAAKGRAPMAGWQCQEAHHLSIRLRRKSFPFHRWPQRVDSDEFYGRPTVWSETASGTISISLFHSSSSPRISAISPLIRFQTGPVRYNSAKCNILAGLHAISSERFLTSTPWACAARIPSVA